MASSVPRRSSSPRRSAARIRRQRGPRRPRPRVRKLRLLFVLAAFGGLAVVSMLFGALTSIASDLPQLREQDPVQPQPRLLHVRRHRQPDRPAGPRQHAGDRQLEPDLAEHGPCDRRGRGSRLLERVGHQRPRARARRLRRPHRRRSSRAPRRSPRSSSRTSVPRRATAPSPRSWSRPAWPSSSPTTGRTSEILTEYLNTIYFGNGALGIEAAARVYFGWAHGYDPSQSRGGQDSCGDADAQHPDRKECASVLHPAQAALLAGMVANPTAFNPAGTQSERAAAKVRRDLVLEDMYHQHYISYARVPVLREPPLPPVAEIKQPQQQPSAAPYFTSWVEPQVVARTGERGAVTQAGPVRGLLRRAQDQAEHRPGPAERGRRP